jgi:hypothetical protein
MTNFVLFVDVTTGRFQKLKPIISKPLLLFFLNFFWHIFYATMGAIEARERLTNIVPQYT